MLRFRILGPIDVWDATRSVSVAVGGPRQIALLAHLLIHANRPVSADRLIEELWGESGARGTDKRLQMAVARLRKVLDEPSSHPPLQTVAGGYMLTIGPGELDSEAFESSVAAGTRALEAGDGVGAAALLREALALWRGPPLADLAYEPFAQVEIARLEEVRLAALEARIDADLACGRHAGLVGELQTRIAQHPLRERLRAQLMLALYRAGRQAEALAAYHTARRELDEQLGLQPAEELKRLERAILAHDPALDAPLATGDRTSDGRHIGRLSPGARSQTKLPVPPNRTIGREHEITAVAERVRAAEVRLLTLTGPGGVGKTRLALEAARAVGTEFDDGAHFVSLAALRRSEEVAAAVVKALAVVVLSGESPSGSLARFLASKQLLLVLDNFEHVLEAAPVIGDLLVACPTLTVLATSRAPLMLQAEDCYPVAPLALPDGDTADHPAALASGAAVALFADRARARDPEFELSVHNAAAVAEICRRVDGLPLAIELAAGRCGLLSPREIAERMGDAALSGFAAGPRDAPARQRTLRATIDWSHDLLSEAEAPAFSRLAVFAGGASIEAAETITGADLETLDALVAKSLLVRRDHARALTRLDMMETIRAYAAERFAADIDQRAVRERHYRYYLALAQHHGSARALEGPRHREHFAWLDAEIDNLQAALRWVVGEARAEPSLALAVALGRYWMLRSRHAEAVTWIDSVLALPGADAHPELQVRALCFKVWSVRWVGRAADQPDILDEAEAIARRLGDPLTLSLVLQTRANCEVMAGHPNVADPIADEAILWATTAGDKWEIATSWNAKALAASTSAELRQRVERAASLLLEVGNQHELGDLFGSAAYAALSVGSDRDAKAYLDRAVPFVRDLDDPLTWMVHQGNFGLAAIFTGDIEAARDAFREELHLCRELAVHFIACEGLIGLAAVAAVGGDVHRAARLVGAASAHHHGVQQEVVERRLDQAFFRAARRRCGDNAWDAAVREGARLSFEEAIAYALDDQHATLVPTTSTRR